MTNSDFFLPKDENANRSCCFSFSLFFNWISIAYFVSFQYLKSLIKPFFENVGLSISFDVSALDLIKFGGEIVVKEIDFEEAILENKKKLRG